MTSAQDAAVGGPVGNVFSIDEAEIILDEESLITRLDTLLAKTIVAICEMPVALLDQPLPVRGKEGRTVRGLAFHLGEVALDPTRAAEGIAIVKAMHEYDPPDSLRTPHDLATAAEVVRNRLAEWWVMADKPLDLGVIDYYQGPYTFHGLLERTAWHVAMHLRQLAWILADEGIGSNAGLTAEDTLYLPMPPSVWS